MRLLGLLALLGSATPAALVALAGSDAGQVTTILAEPGGSALVDLWLPDPDLALVVGRARGPSLLGIPLGGAPGRVLAVPEDAPADLGQLQATGRAFEFMDPHGQARRVEEYRAPWGYAYGTSPGPDAWDPDAGLFNFVLVVDASKVGARLRVVAA